MEFNRQTFVFTERTLPRNTTTSPVVDLTGIYPFDDIKHETSSVERKIENPTPLAEGNNTFVHDTTVRGGREYWRLRWKRGVERGRSTTFTLHDNSPGAFSRTNVNERRPRDVYATHIVCAPPTYDDPCSTNGFVFREKSVNGTSGVDPRFTTNVMTYARACTVTIRELVHTVYEYTIKTLAT